MSEKKRWPRATREEKKGKMAKGQEKERKKKYIRPKAYQKRRVQSA